MSGFEQLRRSTLFVGLDDERLRLLAEQGRWRRLAAGESAFIPGDPGDALYCVLDGRVEIVLPPAEPDQAGIPIQTVRPGEIFGEFSFIDQQPRSASAVVIDEAELFMLGRDDIGLLAQRDPFLGYVVMFNLAATLVQRLRMTDWSLQASLGES